ncbi:MAG: hypothetical protein R2799_00035 [Crocinitomicaceae bacterium]
MKLEMANNILPISKSMIVDYSSEPIENIWQVNDSKLRNTTINYKESIIAFLKSVSEGVVCIQSASITDKQVIKQIFDTARGREVKIYLLLNQYSPEIDLLSGVCLIRYDLSNTGTFILSNPNSNQSEGLFFGGKLSEQSLTSSNQILIEIKEKEISELFRHFCFHFWESAKKEVKEEGKHNSIDTKPIDVFHDKLAFGERDFIYSTLFDFVEKTTRNKLSGSLIVPLEKEDQDPIFIKPTEEIEIGNINLEELLSPREFEKHTPEFLDNGKSCKIEFKWSNVPFYLPEKSSESSMYEKWRKESEIINNHLNSFLEKIKLGENKEKTISKALSRFFLGKKNSFNKLKSEIEEIKQVDFANITNIELKEKITTINQICNQVEVEIGEIEQEDKKARLDEEIDVLKGKDLEKHKLLSEKKLDLDEKQSISNEKLKNFLEKYKIEESLLGKLKNEWQQHSGHKNKQKNPKEAQEAESKLTELKEIQNQVFLNKIKSEIENLEKEVKRNNDEIMRKENEKSKTNQNAFSKSSLDEFVSNQPSQQISSNNKYLLVPDMPQLPIIGKLYELNNQSYLAIEFWEQYHQGKLEADRLKAKLCAIKK